MAEELILTEAQKINFWSKVERRSHEECWGWSGSTGGNPGYPKMSLKKPDGGYITKTAMHVALLLDGRPRPFDEAQARHSDQCANTLCLNPNHLQWGTAKQNAEDRVRVGRQVKGSQQAAAKLTDDLVAEILMSSDGMTTAARKFGVSKQIVSKIRKGVAWMHVPRPDTMPVIIDRRGRFGTRAKSQPRGDA